MKHKLTMVAVAAVGLLVVAACGSSAKSSTSGGGRTYTVGVLTDMTGLAADNSSTFPLGVKAGIGQVAQQGYNIKYVVADTQSSPTGALTGAQKLVEQDHVFAVIASSALTFAASNYLKSKGVPVIGTDNDSTEWTTNRNMFSVIGTTDYTKVYSQYGLFFKMVGVTNLGSVGYSVSPSSSQSAKSAALSAEAVGIKVGYLNASFPFGSTNTAPAVLAMKAARVNGFSGSVETNTELSIISGLRQQGVDLKGPLMTTGYGGDLVNGGPGAQQAAQGVYFETAMEPIELRTAATERLVNALKTYAGVTTEPTFAEYNGYVSIDALVQGLKVAGAKPTQASLIDAMLGINNYNAAGLFGSHSIGFGLSQRGQVSGAGNCMWVTQYTGTTFRVVAGADPLCGSTIPGKTVSSSS